MPNKNCSELRANCDDIEYKNLFENLKILKEISLNPEYKNQYFYYNTIFKNIGVYNKLDLAKKYCPNLKEESIELSEYFSPETKNKYEEYMNNLNTKKEK